MFGLQVAAKSRNFSSSSLRHGRLCDRDLDRQQPERRRRSRNRGPSTASSAQLQTASDFLLLTVVASAKIQRYDRCIMPMALISVPG
jgi:hypothetical protein